MQKSTLFDGLLLAIISLICQLSYGQSYDMAAGVRVGKDVGVSMKMRVPIIDENFTGELIVQSSLSQAEGLVSLIGAQHFPMFTRRFNLYTGMGVHTGWIENNAEPSSSHKAPAGVSFIGGVEIDFKRLSLSIDYKPVLNLKGGNRTFYTTSAVTIRYIPLKRHSLLTSPRQKRKRQRQAKRQKNANQRSAKDNKGWQFLKKG